jgi:hypothetical protein
MKTECQSKARGCLLARALRIITQFEIQISHILLPSNTPPTPSSLSVHKEKKEKRE